MLDRFATDPGLAETRVQQPFGVSGYKDMRTRLAEVATTGFCIIINHTPLGSQYFDSTYPEAWQTEYTDKKYLWSDPVIVSAMLARDGLRRWSDITMPDIRKVLPAAARYGLNFGVMMSATRGTKKSLLSAARHDREFSDDEINEVHEMFHRIIEHSSDPLRLSAREINVLKCLALDMSQDEIASNLGISVPTVKARLKSARKKAGSETNYRLLAKAMQSGLL